MELLLSEREHKREEQERRGEERKGREGEGTGRDVDEAGMSGGRERIDHTIQL